MYFVFFDMIKIIFELFMYKIFPECNEITSYERKEITLTGL